MTLNFTITEQYNHIETKVSGLLNSSTLHRFNEYCKDVKQATNKSGLRFVLADTVHMQRDLDKHHMIKAVEILETTLDKFVRYSVIWNQAVNVSLFQFLMHESEYQIQYFMDKQDAVKWLFSEEPLAADHQDRLQQSSSRSKVSLKQWLFKK